MYAAGRREKLEFTHRVWGFLKWRHHSNPPPPSLHTRNHRFGQAVKCRQGCVHFYGAPKTHPGNEVFDHLSGIVFEQGRVNVIHDNKNGPSKALRCLRDGASPFILPDVFRDESTAFYIPFYGRAMRVMLGTAALARKTVSVVVPAVAVSSGGMSFRTTLLPEIKIEQPPPERAGLSDYKVTRSIFDRYEAVMRKDLLCWQNVMQHMLAPPSFDEMTAEEIGLVIELLPDDPLLLPPICVIDCRLPAQSHDGCC